MKIAIVLVVLAFLLTACGGPEPGEILVVKPDMISLDREIVGVHGASDQVCLLNKGETVRVVSVSDPYLEVEDTDDPDCRGYAGKGNFSKDEK